MIRHRWTPPAIFLVAFTITLLVAWVWLVIATAPTTCVGAAVLGLDGAHTTYPIVCSR